MVDIVLIRPRRKRGGVYIARVRCEKNLIYPNISQQQQATIGHSEVHNLICSEIGRESSDRVEMVFRVSTKVRKYGKRGGERGRSY